MRDLLSDPSINGYADVCSHTRMAGSRLEVLASEQEPSVSEVGEEDYRRAVDILRHYYNIVLTDCGTGIMHSAMAVHLIPFDPHLAEGADVDFSLLKPATFEAYLELAGAVAEKFHRLRGGRHRQ